jgi:(1->4)-alpha-D-glucan 1-alpha-D-glucosylmutase
MQAYMQKATKEAKVSTSWINPTTAYDDAVALFVREVLAGPRSETFLRLFIPFAQRISRLGAINSLSQLLIKVGSPGVPDFYQGTELWDLSFVDPDNRRPVDLGRRAALLEEVEQLLPSDASTGASDEAVRSLLTTWEDGRIKLYVTLAALRLRRRWAEVFLSGSYVPLPATGPLSTHLVAFARRLGERCVLVVAPRLVASLYGASSRLVIDADVWGGTHLALPADYATLRFRDALTGRDVSLHPHQAGPRLLTADLFQRLPIALLWSGEQEPVTP